MTWAVSLVNTQEKGLSVGRLMIQSGSTSFLGSCLATCWGGAAFFVVVVFLTGFIFGFSMMLFARLGVSVLLWRGSL